MAKDGYIKDAIMFGTHKKLKAWGDAGLLTPAQADAITAYEKQRHQGRLGRGMIGVALFAIIVGVLSLIAANWLFIPASAKITLHLLVNMTLAAAIWWADQEGMARMKTQGHDKPYALIREACLLVLGGLTLTLIALIGQVYQLGGSLSGALLLWQLAILPAFFIFGRTLLTVLPALLALVISMPFILVDYLDNLPEFWAVFYMIMLAVLLPLCLIADGQIRFLRRLRPVWAATSQRLGFILLTLAATLSSLGWYGDREKILFDDIAEAGLDHVQAHLLLCTIFMIALTGLWAHWLLYRQDQENRRFYVLSVLYVLAGIVMMFLPVLCPTWQGSLLAMASFMAYWGFIAWYAHETGAMRLLSLAIFALAIRVWIIYVEAFGGLLSTGLGLIFGGALMLGMIYAAQKLNRHLHAGQNGEKERLNG